MSNEIKLTSYVIGRTLTFKVVDESGDFYHVASGVFETYGTGGHAAASYDTSLPAKGGGVYVGDFPTAILSVAADADYVVQIHDSAITTQAIAQVEIHVRNYVVVTLPDLVESVDASGTGFYAWPYTLTRADTGAAIAGASVWLTSDAGGARIVASGVTSTAGIITFYLDTGTYYLWRALAGYNFTNPQTFIVPTALSGSGTGSIISVGAAGPITRQSILDFLNKAYQTREVIAGTMFDVAIQMALDDLSSKIEILRDTYAASLVSGAYTVNFPSDMMPGGLISMRLEDASGNVYSPLVPFKDGLRGYRRLLHQSSSVSRPEAYIEGEDNKWYIWRPANATYTVLVEYYKVHAQDVTTIAFPGACALAVKTGAAYFEGVLRNNDKYKANWGSEYGRHFKDVQGMYPGEPRGVYL